MPRMPVALLPAMLVTVLGVASSLWFVTILHTFRLHAPPVLEFDLSERSNFSYELNMSLDHNMKSNVTLSSSSSKLQIDIKEADLKPQVNHAPYHNWKLFVRNFQEMMDNFRIYVYPDAMATQSNSSFARIFLPHNNPFDPKYGNYFSEHMFKVSLLHSSLLTANPEAAHLFFLPFSVNLLRFDRRVRSESSISEFIAQYITKISHNYRFWNISAGSDHFYVHCHSVGREAASKFHDLRNNAIQVTCSSSYFQKYYTAHKDIVLPQIWPRKPEKTLISPGDRHRLVFFAGRVQNSIVRQALISVWGNDTDMDIFSKNPSFNYEEGFRRSKYCLHVKGYEVNTARVSDAIHYGCIPVIISNHYELPFANVLDWNKFSVIINHNEIAFLKKRLLSITTAMYLGMYQNLRQVRSHFVWHTTPRGYGAFHMTAYQLWLRGMQKL